MVARVNAGVCHGCGTCAAACRSQSAKLLGFEDTQILAEITSGFYGEAMINNKGMNGDIIVINNNGDSAGCIERKKARIVEAIGLYMEAVDESGSVYRPLPPNYTFSVINAVKFEGVCMPVTAAPNDLIRENSNYLFDVSSDDCLIVMWPDGERSPFRIAWKDIVSIQFGNAPPYLFITRAVDIEED